MTSDNRGHHGSAWIPKTLACVISLCVTLALVELVLPVLDKRYDSGFRHTLVDSDAFERRARDFFASKSFDPDLGWDKKPPARNSTEAPFFLAQSYGDSFTASGHGGATWQSQFRALTSEAILNYGVGGYGLDQAVLKFDKYASRYPARIAILGLYGEMYRRALSYHSFYYFNYEHFKPIFKPFFAPTAAGFELHQPPCVDAPCLQRSLFGPDGSLKATLSAYDYWYRDNVKKPPRGFPRTLGLLKIAAKRLKARKENPYFVAAYSLPLAEFLIRRFVNLAEERHMAPVCLMIYSPAELAAMKRGKRWDIELVDWLKAQRIRYIDAGDYILARYRKNDDFKSLRVPSGHWNERGDRLVAQALAEGLAGMGLLHGRGLAESARR